MQRLPFEPLEDSRVRLEPLSLEHVGPLLEAASADRSTFNFAPVPSTFAEMETYVALALADAEEGRSMPYAVRRKADDRIVGAARLMNFEWWYWSRPSCVAGEPRIKAEGAPPDAAEIGHVWFAHFAQRSEVNTATASLLMTLAFDAWNVHRLVLKTDARNLRSRTAIERLGGKFEGILRAHLPAADGIIRDTAMFSITSQEWPEVKAGLVSAAQTHTRQA